MKRVIVYTREFFFFFLFLVFILSGSMNTIILKLQNETFSKANDKPPVLWRHPFFQSFCVFLGLSLFFLLFWFRKVREKKEIIEKMKMKKINPLIFSLSSLCDVLAAIFLYFGLQFTFASVYQMLTTTVIVFTSILSIIFLKKSLFIYQYLGMFLIILGSFNVVLSSTMLDVNKKNSTASAIIGALFVILGKFFDSLDYIFEEKFMKGYFCYPSECLSYEGLFGLSFILFFLLLINFTSIFISDNNYYSVDSFPGAIIQIYNQPILVIFIISFIICVMCYHFTAICISKYKSSLTRALTDTMRSVVVWIVQIIRGRDTFNWLQFSGFVLIIIGNCIYNQILFIPFYQKKSVKKKKNIQINQ